MKNTFLLMAGLLFAACGTQPSARTAETPATEVVYGEEILLVTPPATGGLTIDEALWKRCSSRDFADEALSLEELSGAMWAAAGINRTEPARLTAPSAMALYPIRTYAFLPGGVYAYDAPGHRLVRVVEGDHRALSGAQPFVALAGLNIVCIADLAAYEGRNVPADHIRYLCGQDAAGYVENVNLYAAGHGLKAVTRGSAPAAELLQLLGLDGERYFFALAVSVGK